MTEVVKRGRGRPRKDEYDENGNLKPLVQVLEDRDIPEDEPEVPEPAPQPVQMTREQALEMLREAAQTPEGRALLGLKAGQGPSLGRYHRTYDRDPNIRVTGGLEVKHGPDFRPLPPEYIDMYVGKDGGTTNYLDPYYVDEERHVTRKDGNGKTVLTEDGNPVADRKLMRVMKHPGAARHPDGSPVLTDGYKAFLDAKMEGKTLNSNVRSDIQAGVYVDEGVPV